MTEEQKKQINYLDKETLQKLCHELAKVIFHNEEPLGIFNEQSKRNLDAVLELLKQSVYGHEVYPTLFEKAATLFYGINKNHPFSNGNKRMSAASLVVFLYINDIALWVDREEFFQKTIWVAKSAGKDFEYVKKDLVKWIQEHHLTVQDYEKRLKDKIV